MQPRIHRRSFRPAPSPGPGAKPAGAWGEPNLALAADLLGISEFRFFELSYREWFGKCLSLAEAERIFVAYMLDERVPFWVRHLARRVLARHAAGELDSRDFGLSPATASRRMQTRGVLYGLLLAILTVALCWLASGYEPY